VPLLNAAQKLFAAKGFEATTSPETTPLAAVSDAASADGYERTMTLGEDGYLWFRGRVIDTLPLTPAGKIDRTSLKVTAAARLGFNPPFVGER
jgi:hypothetical protein